MDILKLTVSTLGWCAQRIWADVASGAPLTFHFHIGVCLRIVQGLHTHSLTQAAKALRLHYKRERERGSSQKRKLITLLCRWSVPFSLQFASGGGLLSTFCECVLCVCTEDSGLEEHPYATLLIWEDLKFAVLSLSFLETNGEIFLLVCSAFYLFRNCIYQLCDRKEKRIHFHDLIT